jgi:hypothetical protein
VATHSAMASSNWLAVPYGGHGESISPSGLPTPWIWDFFGSGSTRRAFFDQVAVVPFAIAMRPLYRNLRPFAPPLRCVIVDSLLMSRYTRLTTLEDAYFFLHCAVSIPSLPSSDARRQRFLRGAVLVAWTAVEDGVNNQWHEKSLPARQPRELQRRVRQLFQHLGLPTPDWRDFARRKSIRNRITHPRAGNPEVVLTEAETSETLLFCRGLLSTLYPDLIVWKEWEMD